MTPIPVFCDEVGAEEIFDPFGPELRDRRLSVGIGRVVQRLGMQPLRANVIGDMREVAIDVWCVSAIELEDCCDRASNRREHFHRVVHAPA